MRKLTTLAMLLAMALPTLGAQTWPAGTNVANIFFRTNQFREATSFGVGHTNIITDGGSKINGVGFTNGIMTGNIRGSTQDGDIPFTFGNNGVLGYDPGIFYYDTNSGNLHAPYFYGIGSNLVYIQATSIWGVLDNTNIPSPLTLGQINVGTLVLTNAANILLTNTPYNVGTFGITVDGGGSVITTGVKGYMEVPYACSITEAIMLCDASGDASIAVWRTNSASFPPTAVGAIGTNTITGAAWARDGTLTGWTTALSSNDIIGFSVIGTPATITRATLQLKVTK